MPQPKLLSKPWALDGLKNNIPAERNGGLAQEAATYAEGFPSITMTPISVGGKPPSGKDMNGVLYEISAHTVWQNQGGRYRFDQAFCDAIGGYPKGSVLISDTLDTEYISLVDANTHNPNSGNNTGKWAIHAGKGLKASTTQAGIVQLLSATNSDREDMAATPKAVKIAYDKAEESAGKGLPVGAVMGFPRSITSQEGFLKADGSTFAQATYPDLYRVLGGNRLPDLRDTTPVGELVMWTMDGALPDYLIDANGQNISRTAYPELFAKWGTRYGAGNGSTTFGVPDWRGEFPRFWDNGRGVDVGRALGSAQADEFKAHTHGGVPQRAGDSDRGGAVSWFSIDGIGQTEAAGGSETRPRNVAVRACIVAKPSDKGINYWIKAYGAVSNAGVLDASTLAAGLQNKSDKGHTHTAAEITDLAQAVGNLFTRQFAETGYLKLPGGLILQWGKTPAVADEQTAEIMFPIAFPNAVLNIQLTENIKTTHAQFVNHVAALNATLSKFTFWVNSSLATSTSAYWFAIGY